MSESQHIVCPHCDAVNRITSARLAKVNTETEQAVAAQFRIQSIPTTALFQNGREMARQPGAMGTANIVRWVQNQI